MDIWYKVRTCLTINCLLLLVRNISYRIHLIFELINLDNFIEFIEAPSDGWMYFHVTHVSHRHPVNWRRKGLMSTQPELLDQNGDKGVIFTFYTHVLAGIVYVLSSFGPANPQVEMGPPLGEKSLNRFSTVTLSLLTILLDILRRFSDIIYLCLDHHAETLGEILEFNYFAVTDVVNDNTLSRVNDLLAVNSRAQVKALEGHLPGYTLNINAEQKNMGEGTWARVLLGTPSCLTAGYVSHFSKQSIQELI